MKFEDLLYVYESQLAYVERMMEPNTLSFYKKTEEYFKGYKAACFKWFEEMKLECEDFKPQIEKVDTKIKRDNGDLLIGYLNYRGEQIPVYDDDQGQQIYIIYNGEVIPGGSYNLLPEYDFCYFIDLKKDNIEY
jgi:hypothetical protein